MAAMVAILKIFFFAFSPKPKSQMTRNLVESIEMIYRLKWLKSFRLEIQGGRHGGHLKNLFFTSSPEPKGLLALN